MTTEKDYTCVPTRQLAEVFERYRDRSVPLALIAERVPMDVRDLKKVVQQDKYRTTGLGLADRILMAIGCNITALTEAGLLTVIPSPGAGCPARMAYDEWWVAREPGRPAPGPQERARRDAQVKRRTRELAQLRKTTLALHC